MSNKFINNLEQKLQEKNLTKSSIDYYIKNLERLNEGPLKNLKFLDNFDNIMDKINKYKDTTKRSYLISIVSILGTYSKPKLIKKYQDEMYKQHNLIKEANKDNSKTDTQKDNWMEWEKVKEIKDNLKNDVSKFSNKKKINEDQYKILLNYFVLSLYIDIPPRRNKDYLEMYVVKNKGQTEDKSKNYYVIDDKEMIFNTYKTSKKEEQLVIKVEDELLNSFNVYLKYHPLNKQIEYPLLVNYKGEHLNKINSITRLLNNIFKKNISSSMLRHIRDTEKYGKVLQDMKEDAKLMSHTVETKLENYIKV